jgi:hypothetical protein
MHSKKDVLADSKVDPSIHSFLIRVFKIHVSNENLAFNSFVSDTVSQWLVLLGCYLFVSVLCESVFVHGFPICRCKISLVFSLCMVNDMDREEGPEKNSFYKDASSRKALKPPVENVSTEISRGTLSSHPESRWKNLCFSLSYIFNFGWGDVCAEVMDIRLCVV